ALGYVAGTLHPAPASGARNPATMIATWNDFEDALSALTAHVADAVGALRRLASANPDAPVLQATYARALKEAGQVQAALAIYRRAARRWPKPIGRPRPRRGSSARSAPRPVSSKRA